MQPKRFSTWGDLAAAVAILFAATLTGALCLVIIKVLVPGIEREALTAAAYTVQFLLAIAGACAWYGRGGVKPLLRYSFNWYNAPLAFVGIVLVTAAGIAIEPVLNLFPERYFEQLGEMIGSGGWAILFSVVLAPLLEEIFFRGLVLEHLSRRWSALWAVAVSALLFGAVHLPNLPQAVNALVMGVVLGYVYVLTRSLVPVVIIHAINNGVAYLLLRLTGTQSTDTRTMIGNDAVYWAVFGTSVLLVAVSVVAMALSAGNKTIKIPLHEKTDANDVAQ